MNLPKRLPKRVSRKKIDSWQRMSAAEVARRMSTEMISLAEYQKSLLRLFDLFSPYVTPAQRKLVGDQYLVAQARAIFGEDSARIVAELFSAPPPEAPR